MSHHLYGDSTVFPYDLHYIELSRHAVECAVQLFSAQHAIASAGSRAEAVETSRSMELARLAAMSEALDRALEPFLASGCDVTVQVAARVLERVRSSVEHEQTQSERRSGEAAGHTRHVVQRAGESAQRALEAFLAQNDLPDTELGLRLEFGAEQGPSGE